VQAALEKAGLRPRTHVSKELEVDKEQIDAAVQAAAEETA
jgi:hypothetical protein